VFWSRDHYEEDCDVEGLSCIADGYHVTLGRLGDASSV
jgi:hypothetical protein